MTRAYTDMDATARELAEHLNALREAIKPVSGSDIDTSLCSFETYCAVSLRVMKKTNPSKVRDCARTVEIYARLQGIPIVREAA